MDFSSMVLLGLMGTGHCVGMCGPLVVAFPARYGSLLPHLTYHAGRLTAYAVIGGVIGWLNRGMLLLISAGGAPDPGLLARIQVLFSLAAAVFMLVFGMARLGMIHEPRWMLNALTERFAGIGRMTGTRPAREGGLRMLAVGFSLGFLPCGLSYAAFARALAADGFVDGAMLLLAFGAGTLPGLLILGTGASGIFERYRRISDLVSGMIMIAMAAWLFARAAGLIFR